MRETAAEQGFTSKALHQDLLRPKGQGFEHHNWKANNLSKVVRVYYKNKKKELTKVTSSINSLRVP